MSQIGFGMIVGVASLAAVRYDLEGNEFLITNYGKDKTKTETLSAFTILSAYLSTAYVFEKEYFILASIFPPGWISCIVTFYLRYLQKRRRVHLEKLVSLRIQ